MTDNWREYSVGQDLDVLLAQANGWTQIYENKGKLWGHAVWVGKDLEVPGFSTDPRTALPIEGDDMMEIVIVKEGAQARMSPCEEWEIGETLAEARARAWLASYYAKEAQK